jgi:thymidylate kinase
LDEARLPYCRLRGPGGDEASGRQEIDLLVARRDLERLAPLLARLGFVKLRTWGHGGHRFYVAYEERAGVWLKLDIVTRLRYGGPHRPLACPALAGTLDRRQRLADAFVPDPTDALLGLLLHATLDKRGFKEHHQRELERLRAVVDGDPALGAITAERFDRALGRALRWPEATTAISDANWGWLLSRRPAITRELVRRAPLESARNWLAGQAARLFRPLWASFRRPGFFVALLGPDGAGKSTVARVLADDPQIRARVVYMGSKWAAGFDSDRGRGRGARRGVTAYGKRLLVQAWRSLGAWAFGLRGRFVVFDRHPHELRITDAAHGPGSRLRRWLLERACIRPDLTVLLDASPERLRSRKSEQTLERAAKQRERYRALAQAVRGLVVVDSSVSQEETVRRITSVIWSRYRQRLEGTS